MGLNWSAAFGAAGQGLQNAAGIHAQQDLEAMKDARAENLARFQMQWREQHDQNMQDKQFQHDERVAQYTGDREDKRNAAALDREKLILSESERRQQAATAAMMDRQDRQLSHADDIQRKQQLFQLQDQARREAAEFDAREKDLRAQLQKGMDTNISIKYEQDPIKKAKLIAADPTLSQISLDLAGIKSQRKKSAADFVMRAADLGDPRFTGLTDAQVGYDPNNPAGGASSNSSTSIVPPGGLLPKGTLGLNADPTTSLLGPLKAPSLIQFGPGQNTNGAGTSASDPSTDPSQVPSLIQ